MFKCKDKKDEIVTVNSVIKNFFYVIKYLKEFFEKVL